MKPDLRSFQGSLNAQKLLRRYSEGSDAISSARAHLELYCAGQIYNEGLPDTDVKPADDLALMAAQELVEGWADDGRQQSLVLAALILLVALGRSPANGEARLLLVQVYRLLGLPSLILQQLEALKMRTFQQDTVLHVVTSRASSDALIGGIDYRSAITRIILQRRQMYIASNLEVGDALAGAFTNEAYSQVAEMLALDDKLARSFQRSVGELELIRQSALNNVRDLVDSLDDAAANLRAHLGKLVRPEGYLAVSDTICTDGMQDNRDFDLLQSHLPTSDRSVKWQRLTIDAAVNPEWVRCMATAWLSVLDPKGSIPANANESSTLSETEKALVAFARSLGGEFGAADVEQALSRELRLLNWSEETLMARRRRLD